MAHLDAVNSQVGVLVLSDVARKHLDVGDRLQLIHVSLLEFMPIEPVVWHDLHRHHMSVRSCVVAAKECMR